MFSKKGESTRNMYPIVVYLNEKQYKKTLYCLKSFYLLLKIPFHKNICNVLKIMDDCLRLEYFKGIVFDVSLNEILLDRLFFLKEFSINLTTHNKNIGIWGIPYCTLQDILGDYHYSLLAPLMISENSKAHSKCIPHHLLDSSMLFGCKRCIDIDECCGLGNRNENYIRRGGRIVQHTYNDAQRQLYRADNNDMKVLFESFMKHIDISDEYYAYRYVYFVKNIDYGSRYSFNNRFVYHCDFLPKHELDVELKFLKYHVINTEIIARLKELHLQDRISRIAYSKAIGDNTVRESFYVSPSDVRDKELLQYFQLTLDVNFTYKLNGLGIDYYDDKIKSYKIYCMVKTEILKENFSHYLKAIDIDVSCLSEKEHYYSVRYDKEKNKVSERIDLVYDDLDYEHFKHYIQEQGFSLEISKKTSFIVFAFEFENRQLKKINLYYKHRLLGM